MDRSIKMLICLVTSILILTACSGGEITDTASLALGETSSESKSETMAETMAEETTTAETEQPKEPSRLNVAPPVFSVESGVYGEQFQLELSCPENVSGDIYYTLDGSDPAVSTTRILYSEPINVGSVSDRENVIAAVDPLLFSSNYTKYSQSKKIFTSTVQIPENDAVDKCTVIRAVAETEDGYSDSAAHTYFIGTAEEHINGIAESCEASGNALAVVSITINYDDLFDSTYGIYVKGDKWNSAFEAAKASGEKIDHETARRYDANYNQKGREWERECHVELFEMSPESCTLEIAQNCGIRIQGNYSRSDLQKGFRLFARKDYGEKRFNYDVFGDKTDVDSFKSLVLRAGGNCAFSSKFNDTYWQTISEQQGLDCSVKRSRPCVVYINGEYFGLYVLEEDYSEDYLEDHYGVNSNDVVIYKGDAEKYSSGYYLDEGTLPEGVTDEGYYFRELFVFFRTHKDLKAPEDYAEFSKLVDTDSVRDYFLAEVWINNKWDWPGKNWSMWKTTSADGSVYGDGRWRFLLYDMEFGGVSGKSDAGTNTVKEDNYKPLGLLDMDTNNPAVLCYAYLMTNEDFRNDYCERLQKMSEEAFAKDNLRAVLDDYISEYSPLYYQFFDRYPGSGSAYEAIHGGYSSASCIGDFIEERENTIPDIVAWINKHCK